MPTTPLSIPILFLKTPTAPTDPYTALFTTPPLPHEYYNYTYTPHHIPVLAHTHNLPPLLALLNSAASFPYGGLIFTSQRAVAAFAAALESLSRPAPSSDLPTSSKPQQTPAHKTPWQTLELPLYTVGPATASALRRLTSTYLPRCWVEGDEAGRGEVLAQIILERYNDAFSSSDSSSDDHKTDEAENKKKKPLLFITGEKRRDIIPRALTSPSLPPERRIPVEEMIVYSTSEVPSFEDDFAAVLKRTEDAEVRWVVLFSPAGGGSMLRALGWLHGEGGRVMVDDERGRGRGRVDERKGRVRDGVTGDAIGGQGGRETFIASIGSTTQAYLREGFEFEVDVCAEAPSAEGVKRGVEEWMEVRMGR